MTYPAKVLLFGEHIVMQGASALAAPLPAYGGQWAFAAPGAGQMRLHEWAAYLAGLASEIRLDTGTFLHDLEAGLYFESNIPTGYGLGSSGALCAAVYDRYTLDRISPGDVARLPELRRILARMESFFHGSSSGADPLICYLGRPVLLKPGGSIEPVELPPLRQGGLQLFLLDSGRSRQTGPLVQYFRERCNNPAFDTLMRASLLAVSEDAIQHWLSGRLPEFEACFLAISRFQMEHLALMIPEALHDPWRTGLQSGAFSLKLCGAGGGGVFLGLCRDITSVQTLLSNWELLALQDL